MRPRPAVRQRAVREHNVSSRQQELRGRAEIGQRAVGVGKATVASLNGAIGTPRPGVDFVVAARPDAHVAAVADLVDRYE
jgi:hypothetical protein